jgi:hypothetical protein
MSERRARPHSAEEHDLKNAPPKTGGSPTLSLHSADQTKYVVDEVVAVVESPVSEARMREMFKAVDAVLRTHKEVGDYNQTI